MNDLYRELAPISAEAWTEIMEEAKHTLKLYLAARKLVDFSGPLGWSASAVSRGRASSLVSAPGDGVEARLREVQPLIELRVPFELARSELDAIPRGAKDHDLQPVIDAARHAALAEDRAIFHGYAAGRIQGICEAAAERILTIPEDYAHYPRVVAEATSRLRAAGIDGPYAIALGPRCYTGLTQTTSGGYPVIQHVRRVIEGPIVWAPGVDGAVVLSMRGGDFQLTVGRDFSIGYLDHSATTVRLYLEESLTFLVLAPEAAVPLAYAKKGKK